LGDDDHQVGQRYSDEEDSQKGIEVQNRTDIEIVAKAYNSFGIKAGDVLVGKSGPEEKNKTTDANEDTLKKLKNQLKLGKISQVSTGSNIFGFTDVRCLLCFKEEYDVLSKRYKEAMKHEREIDAFQQMKSVQSKKIVMPHGEIVGTAAMLPYRIDVHFSTSMKGVHPQYREGEFCIQQIQSSRIVPLTFPPFYPYVAPFCNIHNVFGREKLIIYFNIDGVACARRQGQALNELKSREQQLSDGNLRPKVNTPNTDYPWFCYLTPFLLEDQYPWFCYLTPFFSLSLQVWCQACGAVIRCPPACASGLGQFPCPHCGAKLNVFRLT
jgi:hypothetical protein